MKRKKKGSRKAPLSPQKDKMVSMAPTRKCPQCGNEQFAVPCSKCGRTTKSMGRTTPS